MVGSMDSDEQQRLEAIARQQRYVLRPCRDLSPGVMIPEKDIVDFPKIRDYFFSERANHTLMRISMAAGDGFVIVPLELIG
jgi:hypothetical protein